MERKYWVPALERANIVLHCIAEHPSKLRLIDITAKTNINKSTMFSLLQTMETLGWVNREKGDTYSLGTAFAYLGNAYFSGIQIVELFMQKSAAAVERIGETIQLARLDGNQIVYLAKKESASPVRLLSEPGMRMPAYATAMGKMLLSYLDNESITSIFANMTFEAHTKQTIQNVEQLIKQLDQIRGAGYSTDEEEIIAGFNCAAAAVCNRNGEAVAAVSITMATQQWEAKRMDAIREINRLALELSSAL